MNIYKHLSSFTTPKELKRLVKKHSNIVYDNAFYKLEIVKITSNRVKIHEQYSQVQMTISIPFDNFYNFVTTKIPIIKSDLLKYSNDSTAINDKQAELIDIEQDIKDVIGNCEIQQNTITMGEFVATINDFGRWEINTDLPIKQLYSMNSKNVIELGTFANALNQLEESKTLQQLVNVCKGLQTLTRSSKIEFPALSNEYSQYVDDFISNEDINTLSLTTESGNELNVTKETRISYFFSIVVNGIPVYEYEVKKKQITTENFKELVNNLYHLY